MFRNSLDPSKLGLFLILFALYGSLQNILADELSKIVVYTDVFKQGKNFTISFSTCSNLPETVAGNVSSLNLLGNCIHLYSEKDCLGASIKMSANSSCDDLDLWGFNKKAISVGPCPDPCDYKVPNLLFNEPKQIQILRRDNLDTITQWISLRNCTKIPDSYVGTLESVKTDGHCVRLYDNADCEIDDANFDNSSIELKRSTPIQQRDLKISVIMAVSHCLHKCEVPYDGIDSNSTLRIRGYKPRIRKPTKSTFVSGLSPFYIEILLGVSFLSIVVTATVGFIILKKIRRDTSELATLSEKEIEEFRNGIELVETDTFGNAVEMGNDYSAELLATSKPYNKAHEISRSRIKYDSKTPLGMGQFGIVYKGTLTLENTNKSKNDYGTLRSTPVAIKTVKPGAGVEYLRSLLKEVKVMLFIGEHVNIVGVVGSCTENLKKGEVFILMEYCSNGSLESYLQKNRGSFKNIVKKGKIDRQNNESILINFESSVPSGFDFFVLLKWCIEVAHGMEFLASNKVIHSDLAARNVLLTENLTCKISDFGLSRHLYSYTQYVKKKQEPLPWRWLALESLKNMEFSSKSDVWSFGVLCWEIFTIGENPYPAMSWSAAFIANLEEGMRLEKPKYTTTECYNVMLHCWDEDATSRPTFSELIEEFQDMQMTARDVWMSNN